MGRGMLTFKGEPPKKKKKKQKHEVALPDEDVVPPPSLPRTSAPDVARREPQHETPAPPQINTGSGKITASGTVVTGFGTKFEKELAVGDAVIVVLDGKQEMRVVRMRLSDTSCGISSAFSVSLMNPTSYQIIRKPTNSIAEAKKKQEQSQKELQELEQSAFGTFRGTNELVYRERTEHGSYRIQKVCLNSGRSRTDLLTMRAKKTSDKYC